jgi:hypothetical protein
MRFPYDQQFFNPILRRKRRSLDPILTRWLPTAILSNSVAIDGYVMTSAWMLCKSRIFSLVR